VDYTAVERDTVEVMEKHWAGASIKDMQMGPYFMDLAARAGKHGARMPSNYTMLFKGIMTSEGLAKTLIEEVDPIAAITPYFQRMMVERLSGDALQREAFYQLYTLSSLLSRLPVSVAQLLDDFDANRLQIRVQQTADPATDEAKDRRTNRMIWGGFTMTSALCGTLSMLAPQTWYAGVPTVALGFVVLTVLLFIETTWMVFRNRG
jgi:ubiquinone biosynthesis protein